MGELSAVVYGLRCEYAENPLGIDVHRPRLSWKIRSDKRGAAQAAYQVRVAVTREALENGTGILWDTGKVNSDQSIHVAYEGPAAESGRRYYWRVRIWFADGEASGWSDAAWWEMGLLDSADWTAQWITPDIEEDITCSQPSPMLRKEFTVAGQIKDARLYVSALGLYECELNGARAGDQLLTPGWTSYDCRLQYQTYDVTDALQTGDNAIGVMLADGWYRGFLGFRNSRNLYGDQLGLILQLRIEYVDGRVEQVISDETWRAATGPLLAADIYNGETYDARLERPGWSKPGYDDSGWQGVKVLQRDVETLVAPLGPPVRRIDEVKPLSIFQTPAGEIVVDFGQNLVGWVRLRVQGEAGQTVTLRHAEVLDADGNFYTDNLRTAEATDRYTLKGGGEEVYEPRFTFHGFQYASVEGYPGELTTDKLAGIVIHSDMDVTGSFECSDPLVNQLYKNIVWGQKGNFVDVPTDCPQRDERLGWTGDAQVFVRTAAFNMEVAGFFAKWLRDLACDQTDDGSVPFVVPDAISRDKDPGPDFMARTHSGSAAWGDAAVVCPWTIYLCYGDKRILEEQYESMAGWVSFIESRAGERRLWNTGFHFGDWLAIFPEARPLVPAPKTTTALIATAFFAYSTMLMEKAAETLGKEEDAKRYGRLFDEIREAFCAEYVTPNGRIDADTQTAYVLALMFDLLPDEQRPLAVDRLARDIEGRGCHLTTGFVGAPYLCHVLSRFGRTDLAYDLLNQKTFPSWLYPVRKGATTIWERWDGIRPDGTFQDVAMNSFNHYAYGSIGEWMVRVMVGLDTDEKAPGYKRLIVRPHPGGGFTHASATLETPYGRAAAGWRVSEDGLEIKVTAPPNTEASVYVPAGSADEVTEGGKPLHQVEGVVGVSVEDGQVRVDVKAGTYKFMSTAMRLDKEWLKRRPSFSEESRIGVLLVDDEARAVLERHLGAERVASDEIARLEALTLAQAADFAPESITAESFASLVEDLVRI